MRHVSLLSRVLCIALPVAAVLGTASPAASARALPPGERVTHGALTGGSIMNPAAGEFTTHGALLGGSTPNPRAGEFTTHGALLGGSTLNGGAANRPAGTTMASGKTPAKGVKCPANGNINAESPCLRFAARQ